MSYVTIYESSESYKDGEKILLDIVIPLYLNAIIGFPKVTWLSAPRKHRYYGK
jgi:hypothetical protein